MTQAPVTDNDMATEANRSRAAFRLLALPDEGELGRSNFSQFVASRDDTSAVQSRPDSLPLNLVVEYWHDGVLARLECDPSFTGSGDTFEEAVNDLVDLIHHDIQFYESTPESQLEIKSIDQREWLRRVFRNSG